ncbi:MAG: cupredoxin domain-containing protein [Solirubrobacterales bacterium]
MVSSSAKAIEGRTTMLPGGIERTTYKVGPLNVTSGQNRIAYSAIAGADRPAVDGWITRMVPNLTWEDGSIPKSSKVMFHHGVWLNLSRTDPTSDTPERFFATGEEKTNMDLPDGYGYRYENSDRWILNHMIHNLVPEPMKLYITYTMDFIPDTAPAAEGMKTARPIWLDVQNGHLYPVFDVHRDTGGKDGEFTYPEDAKNPYPDGHQKNEWTVDRDGVLLGTTGHVHTGGLSTELYLKRDGAKYAGPTCKSPSSHAGRIRSLGKQIKALSRKQKKLRTRKQPTKARLKGLTKKKNSKLRQQKSLKEKDRAAESRYNDCRKTQPSVDGNRVHLFESTAHYFEPAGPVSWDVAMLSTRDDFRVAVKAGDTLELQTTYETKLASWYESMGINVVWMADETDGDNPFRTKVDEKGVLNHGHYSENDDHGGTKPLVGPDPATLPNGLLSGGPFTIADYSYEAGDFRLPGAAGRPPVVKKGQSFSFELDSDDADKEIWHSLTSCRAPCNKSTGIAYPIADGEFQFDSGQLGNLNGNAAPPTVGRTTWSTPANLPVGTHTYFCRIHPLMRGAFRVVEPNN